MPETKQNDTREFVRERAHTSNKNTILMLPDIIRTYHAMGLLSQGEVDELNDMSTDNARLTFLKKKIPGLAPEQKLQFCEAFVGDDLTTFHDATPAILAGAYRAAFAKAKDDPTQKQRLQKIAARIDELSADFANSSGMIINEKVVDTTNVADLYAGFADMLRARMGDIDKIHGANKDKEIEARKQEMEILGVPLSETQIARINSNFEVLEGVIGQYENLWGLSSITPDVASKLEDRWDKLDYRLARAEVYDETKEIMAKYKFLDDNGEEIPQFGKKGRRVLKGSRLYTIQELARHNVEKRHVGRIGEKINADALEEEFNGEILFLLWNIKTQGQNMATAMADQEIFIDYTKRDEILANEAHIGGEISDYAYRAALFEHENATAGWLARIKTKVGTAGQKGELDRFYDKAGIINGADARMRERMQQFVRILKSFASAFVVSTIITAVATAAAVTAGLSPAAGLAIAGIVLALGRSLLQFHRWKEARIAAGEPHDLEALLADNNLLTSFGVTAIAVIAMVFGAAGMAQAAMALGFGALTLGGFKNGRESYFAARRSMSVPESLAWAIANAGAVALGGITGRMAGHELVDWINGRWTDNTIFQHNETETVKTTTEHTVLERHWDADAIKHHEEMMIKYHWETPESFSERIDGLMAEGLTHDEAVRYLLAWHDTSTHNLGQGYFDSIGVSAEEVAALRASINGNTINLTPESIQAFNHFNPHISESNQVGYFEGAPMKTDFPANAELGSDGRFVHGDDFYSTYADHDGAPYQDVPVTTVETTVDTVSHLVSNDVNGVMATYGNYEPREESVGQRDRVGSEPDKLLEVVLWLERSQAKSWKDLHEQLARVIKARHKNPNPSLANKLWAQQTDIQRRIEQLRNDLGRASDAEIERGAEVAFKREALSNCSIQIEKLEKHKPDSTRGASKTEIRDWDRRMAALQAEFKALSHELSLYKYRYATPVEGIQAQKQREREEIRRQQENIVKKTEEIVKKPKEVVKKPVAKPVEKPVEVVKAPEEIVEVDSKYPMSDKVERIIKGMPELPRKANRDSLASIQNPSSGKPYPPVKALNGVFTWTHDIGFATDILTILPTEQERAQLLREAIDYYKEHNNYDNGEFFNEWVVKDLAALAYDGTISFDTFDSLKEYFNKDMVAVKEKVMEDVDSKKTDEEEIVFAPVYDDEPPVEEEHVDAEPEEEHVVEPAEPEKTEEPVEEIDWSKYQGPFVIETDEPETVKPSDEQNEENPADSVVHGVNVGDMLKKPEEPVEDENVVDEVEKPVEQPKPKAPEKSAKHGDLIKTVDENGNEIPKTIGTYNGLPFYFVDINENGNPIANSLDGPVVVIDWQGIRIPFVLSTGKNPNNPVTPGKWYPVKQVLANGRFHNPEHRSTHIAYETGKYQYNSEREYGRLMEIAKYLDHIIGDIRNAEAGVIPPVDALAVIRKLQDSVYYDEVEGRQYWPYDPSRESTTRDASVSYRAINRMEDPDWHDENYNVFGRLRRSVSRVGDATGNVAQNTANIIQKVRNFFELRRRRGRGEE